MKTFSEMIIESINCNQLSKSFSFSGTLEENIKGMTLSMKLLNSDCNSLIDLYCCIEENIKPKFYKYDNLTVINADHKKLIVKKLEYLSQLIIKQLLIRNCEVPNCIKKH